MDSSVKVTFPWQVTRNKAVMVPGKGIVTPKGYDIDLNYSDPYTGRTYVDEHDLSIPELMYYVDNIVPRFANMNNDDIHYNVALKDKPQLRSHPPISRIAYGYGTNMFDPKKTDGFNPLAYVSGDEPSKYQFYKADFTPYQKIDSDSDFSYIEPLSDEEKDTVNSMRPQGRSYDGLLNRLSNVLNDSHDFSPVLAAPYDWYDYDWYKLPEESRKYPSPRPSPLWTLIIDKETGMPKVDPKTGKFKMRPVPDMPSLPTLNYKHPLIVEGDPNTYTALPDAFNKPGDEYDWEKWGIAPTYADLTGQTKMSKPTERHPDPEPLEYDYMYENLKRAQKENAYDNEVAKSGYFTGSPYETSRAARDRMLRYQGIDAEKKAIQDEVDRLAREQKAKQNSEVHKAERDASIQNKRNEMQGVKSNYQVTMKDGNLSAVPMRDLSMQIRKMVDRPFKRPDMMPKAAKAIADAKISESERQAIRNFIKASPDNSGTNYMLLSDNDDDRMVNAINDYLKHKATQSHDDKLQAARDKRDTLPGGTNESEDETKEEW